MEPNLDTISILTLKEIEGTISPKEKAFLYQALAEHQEAFKQWQELHAALGPEQLQMAEESLQRNPAEHIINAVHKKRKAAARKTWAAVFAVLLVAATFAIYLLFVQRPFSVATTMQAAVSNRQATMLQLTMPDKHVINLPQTDTTFQVNNITLTCTANTLRLSTLQNQGIYRVNVPNGERYTLKLADSSTVQMNAGTAVAFNNRREIAVNGEAYIKVVSNEQQRFLVYLPACQVQVLGTEFNVNTYDSNAIKVALVSGAIKIRSGDKNKILKPGKESIAAPGQLLTERPFNDTVTLSWRTEVLRFSSTATFQDIFDAVTRVYNVHVNINDPSKARLPINYNVSLDRKTSLTDFLGALQTISHIAYQYDETQHLLKIK